MSVMTENTLAGSGGLLRCANNALMDCRHKKAPAGCRG